MKLYRAYHTKTKDFLGGPGSNSWYTNKDLLEIYVRTEYHRSKDWEIITYETDPIVVKTESLKELDDKWTRSLLTKV